jgi:hypothetical protein
MMLEANVIYKGGVACFEIERDAPGLYFARLRYYEQKGRAKLPNEIMLVRGIRNWAGSFDDEGLLQQLGNVIEENWHHSSKIYFR